MSLLRLTEEIRKGLEPWHELSGAVCFEAGDETLTLQLAPGEARVTAEVPHVVDATVRFAPGGLAQLLAHGAETDMRSKVLSEWFSVEGDRALVMHAVLLSLQRPSLLTELAFEVARQRSSAGPRLTQLERVRRPDVSEVIARIRAGIPFIATGVLGAWRAIDEGYEAFVRRNAHVVLPPLVGQRASESLSDFAARLRAPSTQTYTLGVGLPAELVAEFPPPYPSLVPERDAQLWFGAGKDVHTPVTPLHRDPLCGLLGQVFGEKRLTLFPPHDDELLYPRKAYRYFQPCWAQPHAPNLARHPRVANATPVEFVLSPGELLVQPAGWFHAVWALTPVTLSVSDFV